MNNVNPSALLRSLIVYAVCVPLAIVVGYTIVNLSNTNLQDTQSMVVVGVLVSLLIFPLLMKWHYPLMVFCWSFPASLFFLPGHPNIFLAMVAVSLAISVVERILDKRNAFLPASGVQWPLLAFLVLIIITAELTGGFGLRSMGSDVYGGKKYVFLIVGIMSFFALIARPIPKKHANLYITLYFAGAFFSFITDLYTYTPAQLQAIYLLFPPSVYSTDATGTSHIELGVTRLGGVANAAGAVVFWMLARHGFRGAFLTGKLWRPLLALAMIVLVGLGGFRSSVLSLLTMLGLLFVLEKMYRTGMMLVIVLAGVMGAALLVPLAPHLPFTFQRSLAFLPLNISADARLDAEASTEWRLEIWEALMPQIPKYLLVGKGFAFSAQTFNESMGANATFRRTLDAAEDPLALSSDFHSGPLSLLIPFGIWAVLIWMWYCLAGLFVVWRNYQFGDPALRHINRFLFASFVCKCVFFIFIFGDVVTGVGGFAGDLGLSIALNHGVMRRPAPSPKEPVTVPQQAPGHPDLLPKPAFSALRQ